MRILIVLLFLYNLALANNYTTNFPSPPAPENPISENGIWVDGFTLGKQWSNVATIAGEATGDQTPDTGAYNDSTAILTGTWGPTQTAQITVINNSPTDGSFREIEIRLRSTLTANFCSGYEVYWSAQPSNPYLTIARWNGPVNSYANLGETVNNVLMHTGDMLMATISGSTITAFINGVQKLQVTDTTFNSGNPGMGFYLANTGGQMEPAASQYGILSFSATDGGGSPSPTPSPTPAPTPTPSPTPGPTPTPTPKRHHHWF